MTFQINRNTLSGIASVGEEEFISGPTPEVIFNEWWNGEGLDFLFVDSQDNERPQISLHCSEIETICAIAMHLGFINKESVDKKIDTFREDEDRLKKLLNY